MIEIFVRSHKHSRLNYAKANFPEPANPLERQLLSEKCKAIYGEGATFPLKPRL